MTSTMYMSCHILSKSASGRPRTCGHRTMAGGGSAHLSWCTPPGGGAHLRENECENCAIFAANSLHICVRNGSGDTGKARGRRTAICGATLHRNVSKRGQCFRHPVFDFFFIILKYSRHPNSINMFIFSQICYLCTHIRAIFAPHSKVPLPAVRKGFIYVRPLSPNHRQTKAQEPRWLLP